MSNYTYTSGFLAKDSLPDTDADKVIQGADFETEFTAVQTAVNSKADSASPTFTGTLTAATVTASGAVTSNGTLTASSGASVTGNITVTGTVDGRDVATDGTKLDGIETGATGDQTGAEIKVAYEAESDTNAFTDAEKTKLSGIDTGANAVDKAFVDALAVDAGSVDGYSISVLTQSAYDALTPDSNTLYFING